VKHRATTLKEYQGSSRRLFKRTPNRLFGYLLCTLARENHKLFNVRGYQHDNEERATSIQETLTALTELVKEGKIRHVAISNETPWGVSEYLRLAKEYNLAPIVAIQNQYSLTNRTYEIGLAEFSMRENIPLLAYSVLNMGVLTGKYLGGAKPEGARFTLFERNGERYNPPRAQESVQRVY
jgi:aryl-alcohol dehydrogenase-like predicted oxidoreductase